LIFYNYFILCGYCNGIELTIIVCVCRAILTRKKTKKGPPDHEELLQQFFGGIVVDGSGECAPGEELGLMRCLQTIL
jgi:hypothetical protein